MAITRAASQTKRSPQYIQNATFDEDFNVMAFEVLTHNPVSDTLERVTSIQGNGSLVLTYTSGNLTKIEKTVGATTYTKDLTYTDDALTGVSTWS